MSWKSYIVFTPKSFDQINIVLLMESNCSIHWKKLLEGYCSSNKYCYWNVFVPAKKYCNRTVIVPSLLNTGRLYLQRPLSAYWCMTDNHWLVMNTYKISYFWDRILLINNWIVTTNVQILRKCLSSLLHYSNHKWLFLLQTS